MLAKLTRFFSTEPELDENGRPVPTAFQLYLRILPYLKQYWWRVIVAMLITIPIGALDAAVAAVLKPYMDNMQSNHSMAQVSYIPFLLIALTGVQGILNYFSIYLNGWLSFHIANNIRYDLFEKLLTRENEYFDRTASGQIIQRYFRDPEALQMNMLENSKQVLTRFFSSLALAGTLIYMSWQLSIVALTILLLILYPTTYIRKILRELSNDLTASGGLALNIYNEATGGIKVVYGYNLVQHQLQKLKGVQRYMFDRTMKKVKTQGWLTPSMHMIASIGIALIIWLGSMMVTSGKMTTGSLVAFIAALIMLYNPIKTLGHSVMTAQLSLLAANRIFTLLDKETMVTDAPHAVELDGIKEGIKFDDVFAAYRGRKGYVLRKITLDIPVGQTIALVGGSGSGKSTIAALIPRFYDVRKGKISIDGIDIREIKLESLRKHIALVLQDTFLFDGTIKENIMLGKLNATNKELEDAVEKAYLKDFLIELSEDAQDWKVGLEKTIGERGVMLSGGQRQRIAIARALLKDAPIVILDEATSALDSQSEEIVQQAIESLMADRTVIMIAHRLSTIRNADRIVVLDNTRIKEQGTHDELLAQNGLYKKLYSTQFGETGSQQTQNNIEQAAV